MMTMMVMIMLSRDFFLQNECSEVDGNRIFLKWLLWSVFICVRRSEVKRNDVASFVNWEVLGYISVGDCLISIQLQCKQINVKCYAPITAAEETQTIVQKHPAWNVVRENNAIITITEASVGQI